MKQKRSFAERFHAKQLHAWELGALIAMCNMFVAAAMVVFTLSATIVLPVWLTMILISPLFFALFWLWISQELLRAYHRFSFHDALLISKFAVLPFVLLFCAAAVLYASTIHAYDLQLWVYAFILQILLLSVGSAIVCGTVLLFGLRHPFRSLLHS